MIYWVLYGILMNSSAKTNNINIVYPLLFKTETQCLKRKEYDEKDLINKFTTIDLMCEKIEVTK